MKRMEVRDAVRLAHSHVLRRSGGDILLRWWRVKNRSNFPLRLDGSLFRLTRLNFIEHLDHVRGH